MTEFLIGAAGAVMLTVVIGMVRILRGPGDADRVMAAQLLGTGGVAALLLSGIARGRSASLDLALTLAVLAAFASIAFVKGAAMRRDEPAATTTAWPVRGVSGCIVSRCRGPGCGRSGNVGSVGLRVHE